MSILDFVTQDELDQLDEDPRLAFMELINIAQRTLSSKLGRFSHNDEDDWREMEDLRHSFMNVVVASSKRFEIEPFASMDIPRVDDHLHFKQFKSDLDHYITQLVLDNSAQSRRDSVMILPKSKDKIRSYIHGLRECIEKGNMTDAKRTALLKRLDELEKELEKRRANMLLVAKLAFEVLAIPGGTWASYEVATKLITNISQTVEESRQAEQATKPLPEAKPIPALSPPRKAPSYGGGFPDDLDDDVPF
ncbi:hypothetical protein [Sphingomonas xinjiangensis]|uniref:Uncharacterized protein n=1 Tax=Sphingomonas xinjiangensis TaxID=643568 RepID=A0A840YAW0_9SPHN|nr:hypothetical protein [Sphingomonas xinjiangensis]MBB5709425.1 hypothetical protein [Sphingomonas xinjiangensis]